MLSAVAASADWAAAGKTRISDQTASMRRATSASAAATVGDGTEAAACGAAEEGASPPTRAAATAACPGESADGSAGAPIGKLSAARSGEPSAAGAPGNTDPPATARSDGGSRWEKALAAPSLNELVRAGSTKSIDTPAARTPMEPASC